MDNYSTLNGNLKIGILNFSEKYQKILRVPF